MSVQRGHNQRFQSTPSVWRETDSDDIHKDFKPFQSTPSVWRETPIIQPSPKLGEISIHSLRVEGDSR